MQGEEALIIAGNNQAHLYKAGGNTADIISAIREADTVSISYVEEFAHTLEGANVAETCANIWGWVRKTIPYVEDGTGIQKVQLPGQLYNNRYQHLGGTGEGGDCKSMSLMCSSILRSLGNYNFKYRFITENRNENFHHVYLIVEHEDEETGEPCYIPLDCTLENFAVEVNHAKKKDVAPTHPTQDAFVGRAAIGAGHTLQYTPGSLNGFHWYIVPLTFKTGAYAEFAGRRQDIPDGWLPNDREKTFYPVHNPLRYATPIRDPNYPKGLTYATDNRGFEGHLIPDGWIANDRKDHYTTSDGQDVFVRNTTRYDFDPYHWGHPEFDPEHPFGLTESRYTEESYWEFSTNKLKLEYFARKDALLKKFQENIFTKWNSQPIKYSLIQDSMRKRFDDYVTFGSCLIYKYWGHIDFIAYTACRGIGATSFPGIPFPPEYAAKRQTSDDFHKGLIEIGIHHDNIVELCNLGIFQKYGIPLDYMLYRCYCLQLYGQPWSPHPGVPYWNNTTSTFITQADTPEELGQAIDILNCWPAQGGIGRPFGEPYWSFGGWVLNNGASDTTVKEWRKTHPEPGFVYGDGTVEPGFFLANNGAGISWDAQLKALDTYNKWMKGNLVMLPQPIYNPDVALLSGHRIGEPITLSASAIAGIITAVVAAVATVATIIAKLYDTFKKDRDGAAIPVPTMDFKWDYQTADGCLIGTCMNPAGCQGATTAKMCNGEIVELNPNPNDPKNQPPDPGNFFTGADGRKKLLMVGGLALTGAVVVGAMDN